MKFLPMPFTNRAKLLVKRYGKRAAIFIAQDERDRSLEKGTVFSVDYAAYWENVINEIK